MKWDTFHWIYSSNKQKVTRWEQKVFKQSKNNERVNKWYQQKWKWKQKYETQEDNEICFRFVYICFIEFCSIYIFVIFFCYFLFQFVTFVSVSLLFCISYCITQYLFPLTLFFFKTFVSVLLLFVYVGITLCPLSVKKILICAFVYCQHIDSCCEAVVMLINWKSSEILLTLVIEDFQKSHTSESIKNICRLLNILQKKKLHNIYEKHEKESKRLDWKRWRILFLTKNFLRNDSWRCTEHHRWSQNSSDDIKIKSCVRTCVQVWDFKHEIDVTVFRRDTSVSGSKVHVS